MNRWKGLRVVFSLVVILFITLGAEMNVHAVDKYGKDPKPGTAPEYIEKAIKAGMDLVGKSPYNFGGGRTESTYGKRMDCSSLMHYMWNKGAGILIVNNNPKHAGNGPNKESAVTTTTLLSNMDVKTNMKINDLKRGDMIFFPGHVGMYLGDGIMINDASSSGVSLASITRGYWASRYNGKVIRVKEGGRGVKAVGDVDFSAGGSGEDPTSSKEDMGGDVDWEWLDLYEDRKIATNKVGLKDETNVVGTEVRSAGDSIAKKWYKVLINIGVILSAIFLVYSIVGVVMYLVATNTMIGRGNTDSSKKGRYIDNFEKITGLYGVKTRKNTINVFGRFFVSLSVVLVFLLGLHVPIMAGLYNFLSKTGLF